MTRKYAISLFVLALALCVGFSAVLAESSGSGTEYPVSLSASLEGGPSELVNAPGSRAGLPITLLLDAVVSDSMTSDVAADVLYCMQDQDAYLTFNETKVLLMLPMKTGSMAISYDVGAGTAVYSVFPETDVAAMVATAEADSHTCYLVDRTIYNSLLRTIMGEDE